MRASAIFLACAASGGAYLPRALGATDPPPPTPAAPLLRGAGGRPGAEAGAGEPEPRVLQGTTMPPSTAPPANSEFCFTYILYQGGTIQTNSMPCSQVTSPCAPPSQFDFSYGSLEDVRLGAPGACTGYANDPDKVVKATYECTETSCAWAFECC